MFYKGETVNYFLDADTEEPTSKITITNVYNNIASALSGSFDGIQFLMTFDAETGEGVGQYKGARIEHR